MIVSRQITLLIFIILLSSCGQNPYRQYVVYQNMYSGNDGLGIQNYTQNVKPYDYQQKVQTSWVLYSPTVGWTSFYYPAGWSVSAMPPRSATRYVENYGITSGGSSTFSFAIYDPMFLIEELGNKQIVSNNEIFRNLILTFTKSRTPEVSTVYRDNREYMVSSGVFSDGTSFQTIGFVDASGYLNAVSGFDKTGRVSEDGWTSVFFLASTLKIRTPTSVLSPAENAMRQWHSALRRGDAAALMALTCDDAKPILALTYLGVSSVISENAMAMIFNLTRGVDYSGLRYQTLGENGTVAAIRTSGNLIFPDGNVQAFSQTQNSFGSNVTSVRYENGDWRVCEPVKGGRQ